MSQIKLKHSGGNSVIIAAPDSNPASDRTLKLPSNADGTVLTTTNPKSGNIIQVVTTSDSERIERTSTSISGGTANMVDIMSLAITPSSSSSKILISAYLFGEITGNPYGVNFRIKAAISGGSTSFIQGADTGARLPVFGTFDEYQTDSNVDSTPHQYVVVPNYLHSPSTSSTITYSITLRTSSTETFYKNRSIGGGDGTSYEDGLSYITLMEVAG